MKKIMLLLLCMILLVAPVSALEISTWDNVLNYKEDNMKVDIINVLGLEKLGTIELKSHSSVDQVLEFGFGKEEVVIYYDFTDWELYPDGLGVPIFTNMSNGEEIEKDYYFVEWVFENVEVNDYKEVCKLSLNGTNVCKQVITRTHLEKEWSWVKLDNKNIENKRIGLKTYVAEGDYMDAVWTIAGKEIKRHASWTADLNVNLIAYYKFDETVGNIAVDSTDNQNGTISANVTKGVAGIIGTAFNFTASNPSIVDITGLSDTSGTYSFSFWASPLNTTASQFLLDTASGRIALIMHTAETGWNIGYYTSGDAYQSFGVSPELNVLKHYVIVLDGLNNKGILYINSVMQPTNTTYTDTNIGGGYVYIGGFTASANLYQGVLDEFAIFNETLTQARVIQLYNGGLGITWTDDFAFAPIVTLNTPVDTANFTTNTINFSGVVSDNLDLVNVSLYIDNVLNETNSSGINNVTYTFSKSFADGDYTWNYEGCDNESQCRNGTARTFSIDTTPFIEFLTPLTLVNYANITQEYIPIQVNVSTNFFKNISYDLFNVNGTTLNQFYTITTFSINFTNIPNANYHYNVTVCTTTNQCNFTETRHINHDSSPPEVIILAPLTTIDHHLVNTNLSINWSANDTHIDTCILQFEGVNRTVTCSDNQTQINITNIINRAITFYVNDTFGNMNSTLRSWDYTIFENSQEFNNETLEGTMETFTANITIEESNSIAIARFVYNGTPHIGSFSQSGNYSILTIDFIIPTVSGEVNLTFFWSIQLSDAQIINLTSHNQTVSILSLDDCSVNTVVLFNYTIVDEGNQSKLTNTTAELSLNLLDTDRETYILNFSLEYSDINPFAVCINENISTSTFAVDSIVKYESIGYSIEYYNIVNAVITNSTIPEEITLYDLIDPDATDFKITFKAEDFTFVENALIYINRQYISENNTFKTVELPKTDSNGQTVGHFVRNDILYNIIVIKDGVVLGNFENQIAFCEDFTIGNCQMVLEAIPEDALAFDYNEQLGIIFQSIPTYNENTSLVSFSFSTDDGTVKTILMNVTRDDIFGNRTICSNTLTSSSGTLACSIPAIDDSVLRVEVSVDGQPVVFSRVTLEASDYGNLGYVLWFFLTFVFILIFGDKKSGVLIGIGVSFIGAIALGVTKGNIIGIGSAGIWMLVIIILGIIKLNKEKPQ